MDRYATAPQREVLTNVRVDVHEMYDGPLDRLPVRGPAREAWPLIPRSRRLRQVFGALVAGLLVAYGLGVETGTDRETAAPEPRPARVAADPGVHVLRPFGFDGQPWARVALPGPAWRGWAAGAYLARLGGPLGSEASARLTVVELSGVATEPCGGGFTWGPGSAHEAAAWTAGIRGLTLSAAPREVSMFGRPAWHLRLRGNERTTCSPGVDFRLWASPWGLVSFSRPDVTADVWFVDVDRRVLLVERLSSHDVTPPQQVQLDQLIGSLQIMEPSTAQ